MSSPAPVIDATGISSSTFSDWLTYFTSQYQAIFGSDAYLGNDSQDAQLIAVIAQAATDLSNSVVATFNSFSPATAQGNGLASVVKINGLQRLPASNSIVNLTLTGTAGTSITNGQVVDTSQNVWNLPSAVVIPVSGSITVTAVAAQPGAIAAAIGTINTIYTPVSGWQTVTNPGAAILGASLETDAALRVRQSQSTAQPSQSIFEGVVAALGNLIGVTRVRGYENNTAFTDSHTIPPNTLAFIVEGGVTSAIQNVIFLKSTPGIPMIGGITATITDANGSSRVISYATPNPATVGVQLTIKPLIGYSANTPAAIQAALVTYIEGLQIGSNVSFTEMIVPSYLPGTVYAGTYLITAITLSKNGGAAAQADVIIAYNEAPVAAVGNVSVTVLPP